MKMLRVLFGIAQFENVLDNVGSVVPQIWFGKYADEEGNGGNDG
jgi:hypothetical protein